MYQPSESGFAGRGGAIALPATPTLPDIRFAPPQGFSKLAELLAELDLVVDLGARIGSRTWWRGLATCTALCAATISLNPGFRPLAAPVPAGYGATQWKEARVLGMTPLAYGADTGRRMAATDAVRSLTDTPERPTIELTATLGRGDGFARVLERAGVSRSEARAVKGMVADVVDLDDIAPGTRMELTLGRRDRRDAERPLDHLLFRARFDLRLELSRIDGALRIKRIPIAVDDTPVRIQGTVGSSLYRSARAAGVPAQAVETFLKTLSKHVAIGSIGASDRFDVVIEHDIAETGETRFGDILYGGLHQGGRSTRLLRWTSGGREQWFEASGVGERHGAMVRPVAGYLTSGFGMRRHPILGFSRFHRGQDFGAPYGAAIVAATDGVVTFAGRHGGHGNYVMLRHGGGMATAYAHMSRIVARRGERVQQGELIGYVGSTGLSTGPHLHYEVYRNGLPINPRSISFITAAQLTGRELAKFKARLGELTGLNTGPRPAPAPKATS